MVDFSKYQEPNKKLPGKKITLGDIQKGAHTQPEKKDIPVTKRSKKYSKMDLNAQFDPQMIDQKINELVNERLLRLTKIGLKHELKLENLMSYIKTHGRKTKLYKLADYFSEAKLSEIENMLKYLHSTGVIKKDKNNWYSLK